MAKRKTIQQTQIEQLTKDTMNDLGRKITVVTARRSKVSKLVKSHLRDSVNWRVRPADTVTISQFFYGKYNTPKGQATPSDRANIQNTPLKNAINDFVEDAKKVYIKEMRDLLFQPIRQK